MQVWLESELDTNDLDVEAHRHFAELLLEEMDEVDSELSIQLVNDQQMRDLNFQYRGKDESTDVLSFSMREGDLIGQPALLGDIVISIETAARQAATYGNTIDEEIHELIFHGLMHLMGFDHEKDSEKWKQAENSLRSGLQKRKISHVPKGMHLDQRSTEFDSRRID